MIRIANAKDKPCLIHLWQTVLGDSVLNIEAFFSSGVCSFEHILLWQEESEIAAAIYLLDAGETILQSGKSLKTAYTYALATHERFRGRGIGGALAKENVSRSFDLGYELHLIRPAEQSLFTYYKHLGICEEVFLGQGEMLAEHLTNTSQKAEITEIDLDTYLSMRSSYLPKVSTIYPDVYLCYALQTDAPRLMRYRVQMGDSTACAFVERAGDTLFIREVLSAGEMETVVGVLLEHSGAKRATFRTSAIASTPAPFLLAASKEPLGEALSQIYYPFVLD